MTEFIFLTGFFVFLLLAVFLVYWALDSQISVLKEKMSQTETDNASLKTKIDLFETEHQADIQKIAVLESNVADFQKQDFESRMNNQSSFDSLKLEIELLKTNPASQFTAGQNYPGFTINQYQYSGDFNK
jgi:hypothetical protein